MGTLKQASVSDLVSERVTRDKGYVVITMRRYPRFIRREYRDEYLSCLSPHARLLEAFLTKKRSTHDHNGAFQKANFEGLQHMPDDEEIEHLARLVGISKKRDVFLVCQCQVGYRCHREMILLMARELLGARIAPLYNEYPKWVERLRAYKKARKTATKLSKRKSA